MADNETTNVTQSDVNGGSRTDTATPASSLLAGVTEQDKRDISFDDIR